MPQGRLHQSCWFRLRRLRIYDDAGARPQAQVGDDKASALATAGATDQTHMPVVGIASGVDAATQASPSQMRSDGICGRKLSLELASRGPIHCAVPSGTSDCWSTSWISVISSPKSARMIVALLAVILSKHSSNNSASVKAAAPWGDNDEQQRMLCLVAFRLIACRCLVHVIGAGGGAPAS